MPRTSCVTWPPLEVVSNVDSGENPNLIGADISDQKFAHIGHPGIGEKQGTHPIFVSGRDRLADQEVVITSHQAKADTDQHQRDEHRGDGLGSRRTDDLAEAEASQRQQVPRDRHGIFVEHGPQVRIRRDRRLIEDAPVRKTRR